jgi:hypothetical protein
MTCSFVRLFGIDLTTQRALWIKEAWLSCVILSIDEMCQVIQRGISMHVMTFSYVGGVSYHHCGHAVSQHEHHLRLSNTPHVEGRTVARR